MVTADIAGMGKYETFPTLSTKLEESEEYAHAIMFVVDVCLNGICVDSASDVSLLIGKTGMGVFAKQKLTGIADDRVNKQLAAARFIDMRARFVSPGGISSGPYLVKTVSPLSRDDLLCYLQSLDTTALRSFLKAAKL